VRSTRDLIPDAQSLKISIAHDIGTELTPKMRRGLDRRTRALVDRAFPRTELPPIRATDLPRPLAHGVLERDGSVGKAVLVIPDPSPSWWNGDEMRSTIATLRELSQRGVPSGRPPRLAGALALSSDIVEAIRADGPRTTAWAFLGVLAIVVLLLRKTRGVLYVGGALLLGVLWLAASSRWLGVRINFANFIAFPITFGIGVDYAVNVVSRYEQDGATDITRAIVSTGSATALCSLTTIIGYSSLLLAENRALFNFGLLAVLGEICCLAAALVCLPALVLTIESLRTERAIVQSERARVG
jgi:hypothetical protein